MTKDNAEITAGCMGCSLIGIILIAISFFNAWIFELLWNCLMPSLFNLPELTYWQSFGIMVLLHLIGGWLFKSNKE